MSNSNNSCGIDEQDARRGMIKTRALETVTVITLTRERPHLLKRAIRSVARQESDMPVNHFILVDDCHETRETLERERELPENVKWKFIPRPEGTVSGQGRAAFLRNLAVGMVRSRLIAFLDDDNEFEQDHIHNLLECMGETGCRAVHSWLKIFYRDGKPFLEERDPWTQDPEESRKVFKRMIEKGVRSSDSNIYRNDIDTLDDTDPSIFVDTNEWLLERDLLVEVPFPEHYSDIDLKKMITEDHKFFNELVNNRICISCSRQATVRYYLGGYSNRIR